MKTYHLPIIVLVYSVLALAGAYIAQYGFGLEPCLLCLYQRIPFAVAIVLALITLCLSADKRVFDVGNVLSAVVILVGAGIAFYHVGVEQGMVMMSGGCEDQTVMPDTLEAFQAQLLATPHVPCDKPQFVWMGLSMAAWNGICSTLVGLCVLLNGLKSFCQKGKRV